MKNKKLKILLILLILMLVVGIIVAINFKFFKNFISKKFNNKTLKETTIHDSNIKFGEKYEKLVDGVSIGFTKLNGWKYEELPATQEYKFALKFYKSSNDKYATLYFYNTMSGVCGTDRRVSQLNLNNGNKVNVGYSISYDIWRDIYFSLNSKEIVMLNHTLDKNEAEELLELVKTADIVKKGNIEDKITLTLKEGSLSDNGAVFVLENKSDKVYTYGAEYDIEAQTDGGWEKIEDSNNKEWILALYTIEPGKTNSFAVDFSECKNKMVSGKKYRVVKKLVENGGYNKGLSVSAEFQMR